MATTQGLMVIVGNGSAGLAALEAIHRTDPEIACRVISEEETLAYSPTALPYLFSGRIEEGRLFLRAEAFYAANNAQLIKGKRVERVLPGEKRVLFADGSKLGYDKLLIATGASPIIPEIKGLAEARFFLFRSLKDAKELMAAAKRKKEAVVVGGGLVGMETASGLIKRGLRVTVVEKEERILPLYFDSSSAAMTKKIYEDNRVELLTGEEVTEVSGRAKGARVALKLKSGRKMETQLLVLAVGMAPNLALTKDSGIAVNKGILVDDTMRTNIPDIFAGGDVAEAKGLLTGEKVINAILPDAVEQGRVAGTNMAGGTDRYSGGLPMNIFNFFGHTAFSCGLALASGDGFQTLERCWTNKNRYRKLVFKENKLVGAILINEGIDPGIIQSLIRKGSDLKEVMAGLAADLLNYGRLAMIKSETVEVPRTI